MAKPIENKTLTIGILSAIAVGTFIWTASTVWNRATTDRLSCKEMQLWKERAQTEFRTVHPSLVLPDVECPNE